jgi:hypothetical protein
VSRNPRAVLSTSFRGVPALPLEPCNRCGIAPTPEEQGLTRSNAFRPHWLMIEQQGEGTLLQSVLCPDCVERIYRDACGPIDDTREVAKAVMLTDAQKVAVERWGREWTEWAAIRDELFDSSDEPPTAYQVTLEQRKRMLARGERPMTEDEILGVVAGA